MYQHRAVVLPAGSYCAGQDDAIYDAINDQGISPCPVGTVSAPGATAKTQCTSSVKLHIGDDVVMNLVSARPTTSPVMVFQVGDTSYYAPMSATETPINSDTNVKYRVLYNETEYWVHDYTVQ